MSVKRVDLCTVVWSSTSRIGKYIVVWSNIESKG